MLWQNRGNKGQWRVFQACVERKSKGESKTKACGTAGGRPEGTTQSGPTQGGRKYFTKKRGQTRKVNNRKKKKKIAMETVIPSRCPRDTGGGKGDHRFSKTGVCFLG